MPSARQQTMQSSSDHMVLRSTGFGSIWPEKQRLASLPASRTPDGSSACVRASFSVARSRSVRAESKRQSKPDPALRGDGGRDFDPQRAQGVMADLAKRHLPARRRRASSRALHAGRSLSFVIMPLKNLRRRDLRPKGPDHNHGELAPRITRLAWARESKASHRVSALSGEPGPPQARPDPQID